MTSVRRRSNPLLRSIGLLGRLGHIIFPIGAVAMLSVPAILVYQFLEWLENGRWPELSSAEALAWFGTTAPHFQTELLQKANEQLLAAPLPLVLFLGLGGSLYAYALFSKGLARICEPSKAQDDASFSPPISPDS